MKMDKVNLITRLNSVEVMNEADLETIQDTLNFIKKVQEFNNRLHAVAAFVGYVPNNEGNYLENPDLSGEEK